MGPASVHRICIISAGFAKGRHPRSAPSAKPSPAGYRAAGRSWSRTASRRSRPTGKALAPTRMLRRACNGRTRAAGPTSTGWSCETPASTRQARSSVAKRGALCYPDRMLRRSFVAGLFSTIAAPFLPRAAKGEVSNRIEYWNDHCQWQMPNIVAQDWRYVVRIATIDTSVITPPSAPTRARASR